MDIPPCPQDTELRNIIDKLAQFVARNGPDFEQMTKNKQKGNPKFQFLYGGEFFNYYQYKVSSEQHTMLKQQVPNPQPVWQDPPGLETPPHNTTITTAASVIIPPPTIQLQPPIVPVNNNHNPELDQINQQVETLQEQIKQSEQNLQAQHTVLLQQQAAQTEVLLAERELTDLQREADEHNVILVDLNQLLLPIVDSCTKDSVQAGKSWILQNANSKEKALCIAHCLLMKVMEGAPPFSHRLHVIYLVNDVLHHCARKNAADIKDAFESVVIPMFCSATVAATSDEQRNKLNKLLDLWKSKANYLDGNTVDAMRRPQESLQQYKAAQLAKYNPEITLITQQTQVQFESYRSQHQAFVLHATQQIAEFEQRKAVLIEEKILAATAAAAALLQQQQIQQQLQQLQQQEAAESLTLSQISTITLPPQLNPTTTIPTQLNPNTISANINPNSLTQISQLNPNNNLQIPPPQLNMNIPPPHMHQPPPNFFPPPGMFPDFSKPPPGFPPSGVPELPPPPQEELFPSVPYYELPAGLMVPLIKLEDTKFRPIDPADIRLPPPAPPSERLLAAVEAFYTVPSHERPRDSEGWEKLGLYEYYKAKNIARKEKDEQIEAGLREVSRSPSPINLAQERSPSPLRRRYTSCSPPPCASQFQQILPPLSASTVIHSPSLSMSSISSRDVSVKGSRRSRSRSRSRTPPIPSSRRRDRDRDREGRGDGRRSSRSSRRRSRSRSHSRSPSPSGFRPSMGGVSAGFQETIDSSNKGHQMLKRMGWGGSGLGVNEQGIDAPISGGDVRDRQDQFKGVGCNMNDPYENFRKNKGAAFITRMKARAEERSQDPK